MSFALVVAAAITLVIGLLDSGLTLIYISIGCSVVAGIVLAIAVLRGRPDSELAGPAVPRTTPAAGAAPQQSWQQGTPAPAATSSSPSGWGAQAEPTTAVAVDDQPDRVEAEAWTSAGSGATQQIDLVSDDAGDEELADDMAAAASSTDGFPIENYDRLRASEIIPLLSTLSRDDLETVRQHETAGMNRFTIMTRIESEMSAEGGSDAWEIDDEEWEADGEGEPAMVGGGGDEFGSDDFGGDDYSAASGGDESPIADYDRLRVSEILPRLSQLSPDDLDSVRQQELAGPARASILNRIARLQGGGVTAPSRTAPSRTAPSRATAKKAPAKRGAAAVKAGAVKKTATSKSAGVKRAPAGKAAVKKAGATKATAAPSPVTKAPATRTAASQAAKATKATKATKSTKSTKATKSTKSTKATKKR